MAPARAHYPERVAESSAFSVSVPSFCGFILTFFLSVFFFLLSFIFYVFFLFILSSFIFFSFFLHISSFSFLFFLLLFFLSFFRWGVQKAPPPTTTTQQLSPRIPLSQRRVCATEENNEEKGREERKGERKEEIALGYLKRLLGNLREKNEEWFYMFLFLAFIHSFSPPPFFFLSFFYFLVSFSRFVPIYFLLSWCRLGKVLEDFVSRDERQNIFLFEKEERKKKVNSFMMFEINDGFLFGGISVLSYY